VSKNIAVAIFRVNVGGEEFLTLAVGVEWKLTGVSG
jgi:hypothetical protein